MASETIFRPPRPLTVSQVAHRLGCAPRTVQRMLVKGLLKGHRLEAQWRVPRDELEAFLVSPASRSSRASRKG